MAVVKREYRTKRGTKLSDADIERIATEARETSTSRS